MNSRASQSKKYSRTSRAKKFAFAWGAVGDHLVFALGKNLDHLKFTSDAGASLLSKPELAQLAPFVEKNLLGLGYTSAGVLRGLMEDQPLTPMLRGVIGAMKENPMFGGLGAVLDGKLADYTAAETAVFKMEVGAQAVAFWWDRGLHLEGFGGARSKAFELEKNLQFARLVDQPGVVAAFAYQRSRSFEKSQREWMEQLFGMIYTAAQELVKAGIAGPQGGQSFAMFEGLVLPALKRIYQADRDLSDKGLGGEAAFVIDVNGKMPTASRPPARGQGHEVSPDHHHLGGCEPRPSSPPVGRLSVTPSMKPSASSPAAAARATSRAMRPHRRRPAHASGPDQLREKRGDQLVLRPAVLRG